MRQFERITYTDLNTGKSRRMNVEIKSEKKGFISFVRVRTDGEEILTKVDGKTASELYLYSTELILKRTPLRLNWKYCKLEQA